MRTWMRKKHAQNRLHEKILSKGKKNGMQTLGMARRLLSGGEVDI